MNDTLKVAGRIGAELGAAKDEVERLRGLLVAAWRLRPDQHYHEDHLQAEQKAWEIEVAEVLNAAGALPQQAEPTDTYTAVDMATAAAQGFRDGQAAVEQAAAQDETLADRMRAAGMLTIDEMLSGAPLDRFIRHAGVNDLDTYGQWLEMKCREFLSMQASRELEKREDDDLYEWVLAHAAAFQEARINFNAARPAQTEQQPTVKECLTVQPMAYAVFAANGNVACFSTQRDHPSLVALEADGHSVVSLAPIAQTAPQGKFRMGDLVKKSTGSEWVGRVCGWYSTNQTTEGYAVESEAHAGSVQIYPAKALEAVE